MRIQSSQAAETSGQSIRPVRAVQGRRSRRASGQQHLEALYVLRAGLHNLGRKHRESAVGRMRFQFLSKGGMFLVCSSKKGRDWLAWNPRRRLPRRPPRLVL